MTPQGTIYLDEDWRQEAQEVFGYDEENYDDDTGEAQEPAAEQSEPKNKRKSTVEVPGWMMWSLALVLILCGLAIFMLANALYGWL